MDAILTEFIDRTRADPALAQDLLEAVEWNLDAAISAYSNLHDTKAVEVPEYQYDPKDFETIQEGPFSPGAGEDDMLDYDHLEPKAHLLLDAAPPPIQAAEVEENEASRRAVVRKKKLRRARGLSFTDAEEVIDKFTKVAVVKQRVNLQEQVIIDEKFFHHSFVYPDFSSEEEALQEYIAGDLLEVSHKKALERSGRLNWWTSTGRLPKLEPLATSGDGNCLLHAASLYMWGLHDHNLILRTALHRLLTAGVERVGLRRRWKYQTQLRNNEAGGLTFTEEEWEFEWGEILRIATNKPRRQPITASLRRHSSLRMNYESLEEVHIFVLAQTLRRPIIVISDRTIKDMSGQDLAPIYFGGIYLPLEVNPTACYKSPVVLAYDSSHFSPLVATQEPEKGKQQQQQQPRPKFARMSSRTETVIPLVTPDGSLLPIQFVYDPKKNDVQEKWSKMEYEVGEFPDDLVRLLESYLSVRWIQLKVPAIAHTNEDRDHNFPVQVPKVRFPAASISQETQPVYQRELIEKYLNHIREKRQEEIERKAAREAEREEQERKRLENLTVPCEGEGCDMFGRAATNNLCSVCYQKAMLHDQDLKEEETMMMAQSSSPVDEDEVDVADIHRAVLGPPPSYKPPELSEALCVEGRLSPPQEDYQRDALQKGASPGHSKTRASTDQSNTAVPLQPRALQASENRPKSNRNVMVSPQRVKQPLLPLQGSGQPRESAGVLNRQRSPTPDENKPKSGGGGGRSVLVSPHRKKQPMLPPQGSEYHSDQTSGLRRSQTPDENTPRYRSRSPTPPPPPPKGRSPSPPVPPPKPTKRQTPPSSPVEDKNALPPPSKETASSVAASTSPSKSTKPSFGGRVSNFASPAFKKSPSPNKNTGYSRDNIKSLHLDGSQQPSNSEAALSRMGVASDRSGVSVLGVKKKCKTVNCEFYGAADSAGYCSSCYKVIKKNASIV